MDILVSSVDRESFFTGKQKVDSIRMYPGGDALNEALVLSHFKADTKLISILGDDLMGHTLLQHLDAGNVSYDNDILDKDIETYISLVLIDPDGERTFVGNREGSVRKLDLPHIRIDEDAEIVSFASLFISPLLNNEKLEVLFSDIKQKNEILCVDCSTPKNGEKIEDMTCLRHADYFFCNFSEAASLCDSEDMEEICRKFKENGINAVIKHGKYGCFCQGERFPAEVLEHVIDSTGAGDSFAAGFILSLSKGRAIGECLQTGNRFGRKACEHIGATEWIKYEECV